MSEKNELNDKIIPYEKQILSFIQKDKKYISQSISGIELSKIKDLNIRKVIEIFVNYYEKYNSLLVKKEFENVIDSLLSQKEITTEKHAELLDAYEESELLELEDDQFERIKNEWRSLVAVPDILNIIKKNNKNFLQKGLGKEFIEYTVRELEHLSYVKEENSLINVYDLDERIDDQIQDLKNRRLNGFVSIPTYIKKLDEDFNGFEPGTLTLIGAVTGGGKSTFVLNITRNIFENEKNPKNVLLISLEMSERQWIRKYNTMDSFYNGFRFPYTDLLRGYKGNISDEMLEKFEAYLKARKQKHNISGKSYKVLEARANKHSWNEICLEMKKKLPLYKPDIIFIDHLALVKMGVDARERNVALGNISKAIRAYGQDNNIPMVAIVQANRASVQRVKGKREIDIDFENVEGSNMVSEDADNFLGIIGNDNDITETKIKIIKQREGGKKTVRLKAAIDYCAIYDEDDIRGSLLFSKKESDKTESLFDSPPADPSIMESLEDSLEDNIEEIKKESSESGIDNLLKKGLSGLKDSKFKDDIKKEEELKIEVLDEKMKVFKRVEDPAIKRYLRNVCGKK